MIISILITATKKKGDWWRFPVQGRPLYCQSVRLLPGSHLQPLMEPGPDGEVWGRENVMKSVVHGVPILHHSTPLAAINFHSTTLDNPASIATLAQRWPNVNPYVGPTSAHQRWANVDLSIGPTFARQRWPNVGPTSAQRWHTNVGPTLAQRYANGCMPTLYQHWPNGGCVTGFLWGEPIGHRSVTSWTNSRVE